jgi:pimeloyl-ACP methyl ester carboxylesterase
MIDRMPTADVNGVQLADDVQGSGDPLVFVCGTGQRADSWAAMGIVGHGVAEGYQVVTFDNRGMPPSTAPPGAYSVETMAADAAALIEHLGLRDVNVAGISLGGFITFELARTRPDLVRGAACIAGLVGGSSYARLWIQAWLEAVEAGIDVPRALEYIGGLPSNMAPATMQDDAAVELLVGLAPDALPDWQGPGRVGQYHADHDWMSRPKEWQAQALGETDVPVLVIAHEFDVVIPPALLRWGADLLPAGRFVEIAGCGHAGVENIPAHREAMSAFFAGL